MSSSSERFYIQYLNTHEEWTCVRDPWRGRIWFARFGWAQARMEQEATLHPDVPYRVVRSHDKGATLQPVVGNGVPFCVSEKVRAS